MEQLFAVNGQLAPGRVERHLEDRAGAGRAHDPHASRDLALGDVVAGAEVEHRALRKRAGELVSAGQDGVGAEVDGAFGKGRVEAEVGPPRLVYGERDSGGMGHLGAGGDVGAHPVVGGRDDEGGLRSRGLGQPRSQPLRGDPVGHAPVGVVLGSHEGRHPAAEDEAVDQGGVRVALGDHRGAERGQGQRQDVVALAGAVGQEPGPLRLIGLSGEAFGLLEGRGAGPPVDPVHVGGHVEEQRVLPERMQQARVGARAALVPGNREAGRAAEAHPDHRVHVRRGRLLGVRTLVAHVVAPAERSSSARTNSSRSPPSTRWTSPTSTSVRWSLTIEYGCIT